METFSASLAICAGNSPVPGEFPTQKPVTRSFDVFFDLRLNKRLSKQSWSWWLETLSRPLWRHRNDFTGGRVLPGSNQPPQAQVPYRAEPTPPPSPPQAPVSELRAQQTPTRAVDANPLMTGAISGAQAQSGETSGSKRQPEAKPVASAAEVSNIVRTHAQGECKGQSPRKTIGI